MTPFFPVVDAYGAVWEAPEIEAFIGLATEIAAMLQDAVGSAAHNMRPPQPRRTGFGGEERLICEDDDGEVSQDGRDVDADNAILAMLDFQAPMDLAPSVGANETTEPPITGINVTKLTEYDSPILKRLLPNASKFDEQVSAEFRYLARNDIAKSKIANLELLIRLLLEGAARKGRIIIQKEEANGVAAALTDFRLALAEQLDIKDEDDAERLEHEAELWARQAALGGLPTVATDYQFLVSVYLVAGLAQESLVQAMLAALDEH